MDQLGTNISPVGEDGRSRKRKRDPSKWKRERARVSRYSPSEPPTYPRCNHNSKAYQCRSLSMSQIREFHRAFYAIKTKTTQDAFVLKHITLKIPARRRPKNHSRSPRATALIYNVNKGGIFIPVCQKAFIDILQIKKGRVRGIAKRFLETGKMATERRGGDRRSTKMKPKRDAVKVFIEQFRAVESHYCRGQSSRQYLPSELNIRKMWKLYQEKVESEMQVKYSYFYTVFVCYYNVSFGSPRTDVCSTCIALTERIKLENDAAKKQELLIEKRVHKLRANAFFHSLREERAGLLTFSFDCEKNLALPKVPDQSAYYSRQLYLYNFTVVKGSSKASLTKENVTNFSWTENERLKGSNEISSALFKVLRDSVDEMSDKSIDTVRLVADGCSGQNKNTTLIGMCCKFLYEFAPKCVQKIELVFPVTGHSYIPPDRVFGLIEKTVRKKEVIVQPEDYLSIFEEHGTVRRVGVDFEVFDWKAAVQETLKLPGQWHFQFKKAKRFFLHRKKSNVTVQGEETYRTEIVQPMNVCRKGKCVSMIVPRALPIGVKVNPLKLRDVGALLTKHYGEDWKSMENLKWYKGVLEENNENFVAYEEEDCDSPVPYAGLVV